MKPLNSTLQKPEPLSDETEKRERESKSSEGKTKENEEEGFVRQSERSEALLLANRGSRFRVV